MTVPFEVSAQTYSPSTEQYIGAVLDCVPRAEDRARIEMTLRSRLNPSITMEEATAVFGRPRDVAEFYLSVVPLESAPFMRRVVAALIDIPMVITSGLLIFYFGWKVMDGSDTSSFMAIFAGNPLAVVLGFAALILMSPVYYVIAETTTSQTVGKAIMGLRTVRESGARITLGQALIRQIPLFFNFYVFDALFALFTKKKQRLFEILSKTRVVRE